MNRKPKKSDSTTKLVLEEIIGLTSKNGNGLASNTQTGDCIYIAGCVVVVYNVKLGTQKHLMMTSRMPKPLNCIAALHGSGTFVAAGESGHQPAVLVWDYSTQTVVSELKVHRFGVSCIAFSPDGKHLVSIGFPHDGYLCLWDWRSGIMVTKIKSSSSCTGISCVSFSSDARVFVTAGKKHLKFWTFGASTKPRSNVGSSLPTLDGKSANLGCQKGSSFVSVASATWSAPSLVGSQRAVKLYPIYALTDAGVLCLIKSGFSVTNWVDLEVEKSFAMAVSNKVIACACTKGVVKLFTNETIKYVGSLQYLKAKEHLELTDTSVKIKSSENTLQSDPAFPDAIACQFSTSEKLVVVYGNHSLYIWDVHDVSKVSRCCVLVAHSACVWDVKNLPCEYMHDPTVACVARGCCGGVSFATCSTDGTIRLWDLLLQPELVKNTGTAEAGIHQQFNSNSVNTEQASALHLASAGIFERDIMESGVDSQGFRSMAVSSDGKYMAAGDCQGNLHLYNLHTSDYTFLQAAHDSEILSLTFSLPSKDCVIKEKVSESHYLLASGGRDRMIHLYDVNRGLELIESLDDHSAAVTSVKLIFDGCKILSCSADRSLVFRDVAITDTGCKISRCHHQIASLGTVYDMAVDSSMEVAVTVGQDKKINAFSISSGKLIKTFKQDGSFGEPIKVTLDPSSSYFVCSYSNKSMCIYDFTNGEIVTQAVGHGEVITGVIFLPDCKHIISVGGDGCIFVWRLPAILSSRMTQRMMEQAGPVTPTITRKPLILNGNILYDEAGYADSSYISKSGKNSNKDVGETVASQEWGPQHVSEFKFSVSRLPKWAQAKVTSEETALLHPESILDQHIEPELAASLMNNNGEIPSPKGPVEVQSPTHHDLVDDEICLTNTSKGSFVSGASENSPLPQEFSSFAMDKRWLTVHTVYHDLLDSPDESRDFKDAMVPLCAPNLLKDPAYKTSRKRDGIETTQGDPDATNQPPTKTKSFRGPHNRVVDDRQHPPLLCEQLKSSISSKLCENEELSGVQSTRTSCGSSTAQLEPETIKDDGDGDRMSQDDDLFTQNFSNLSSALKLETRRLSVRRSYSARFVVRRDHLTGCQKLFEAPNLPLHGGALKSRREAAPQTSSRQLSSQTLEECQTSDAFNRDINNTRGCLPSTSCTLEQSNSTKSSVTDHSMNVEGTRGADQGPGSPVQIQEGNSECKEALLNLETAAESTLQLFSKMESLTKREDATGVKEPDLYDHAANVLPLVLEKIHALVDLVHSRKKDSCSNPRKEEDPC